jgi:hypothetical protein
MVDLISRIKPKLTSLFTKGPPEKPLLGAYQMIIDAEQAAGRYFSSQEIQDLTGWDDAQMAQAAPGLPTARALWERYQIELADYQRKQGKRQARRTPQTTTSDAVSSGSNAPIPAQVQTLEEIITLRGRSFSDLTADELSARRRAILANTPFNLPAHRVFMNWVKETWRVVGPIAFVVFTVWEVYYFMNHFLQASNIFDVVLLWGISLIIEIPFMIATYDQSERRERAAERRARKEDPTIPGKVGSMVFWCLLAAVNIAGQIAFLAFVTRAGYSLSSPAAVGLWGFIILRVTGVIIGDCYTAFHLLPTEADIDRVLRAQRAQMEGEKRLADSDANRLRSDAETKQAIRRIELSVQRDEREAKFIEDWQKMNMAQTLERQRRFMELERKQLSLLPGVEDEPDTGEL